MVCQCVLQHTLCINNMRHECTYLQSKTKREGRNFKKSTLFFSHSGETLNFLLSFSKLNIIGHNDVTPSRHRTVLSDTSQTVCSRWHLSVCLYKMSPVSLSGQSVCLSGTCQSVCKR